MSQTAGPRLYPSPAEPPSRPLAPWGERLAPLQQRLLAWYSAHRRQLPWRETRDPYAILVSEIMLQQTQVDRVIPKYHEFLGRFPTLAALASASRGEVIRTWATLGYNRRAVRLHALAQHVTARNQGELPAEPHELAQLEGLGAYTSAAVACFAFGRQVSVLDTNVKRVLTRILADRFEHRQPRPRELSAAADEALPLGRASDWNQSLMDLGATICTARAPSCSRCPVADLCAARPALASEGPRPLRAAETPGVYSAPAQSATRPRDQFAGSTRYFRGRIVDRLRELPPGEWLEVEELRQTFGDLFGPADPAWLLGLVRGLAADGLLELEGAAARSDGPLRVRLP